MNKGITLLVLVAVLGAMGLVLYSHSGSPKEPAPASPAPQEPAPLALGGQASPLQNLQGEGRGLSPIEPPIGRSEMTPPEGAPVPVALGPDGRAARPPSEAPEAAPQGEAQAPRQDRTPPPAARADKQDKTPPAPRQEKTPPPAPPAQDKTPARSEDKSPSSAPGLEPWSVPPPGADRTAELPAPPERGTPPALAVPATPQPPAVAVPVVPPPVLAEQRLATDPIRPVQSGTAAAATGAAHNLSGISLAASGQGLRLRIEADSAFACKTFVLTGPDRLVVDLPGNWKGMKAPQVPQNSLVKHARLGQQPGGPRLVLDLNGPLKQHRTERSGTVVDILLNQ